MAQLRARRSVKVASRFTINLPEHGLGETRGVHGARASKNGAATRTVAVPGTDLIWSGRRGGAPRTAGARRPARPRPVLALREGKHYPGLFASDDERAYARALEQLRRGSSSEALGLLDGALGSATEDEATAAHLVIAITQYQAGELPAATAHLERVVGAQGGLDGDPLIERYELPAGYREFDVPIRGLDVPGGTVGLGPVFLLVSAYDALGRTKEAVGVMQKLVSHEELHAVPPFVLIILCELYQALEDWDEIMYLVGHAETAGTDDAALILRSYEARARPYTVRPRTVQGTIPK
jgi:hypothetical protein